MQESTSVEVLYIGLVYYRVRGVVSDKSNMLKMVNDWDIITFSSEVGSVNII